MIPNREEAVKLIEEYRKGKSVRRIPYTMGHVNNAAYEAYKIAAATFDMYLELTYVDAMLHDIGRLVVCDEKGDIVEFDKHRHPIEGYHILSSLGYEKQARIAITHAFPGGKNCIQMKKIIWWIKY